MDTGYLVRCLNCKILWRRITPELHPTVLLSDIQLVCPACNSNAYEGPGK